MVGEPWAWSLALTFAALTAMLGESLLSRSNERVLRARGAAEPSGDVYATMAWAYPIAFVAMGIEGALVGGASGVVIVAGLVVFAAAKAIKYWAIAALGPRWTFRVLVPPGAPLVTHGPYAWLRHPNYVGVIGELAGFALLVGAFVAGMISVIGFAFLLRRRISVEEQALGQRTALR